MAAASWAPHLPRPGPPTPPPYHAQEGDALVLSCTIAGFVDDAADYVLCEQVIAFRGDLAAGLADAVCNGDYLALRDADEDT